MTEISQEHEAAPPCGEVRKRVPHCTALSTSERWVPYTAKAGRGRAVVRYWIKRAVNSETAGHFPSLQAAQDECDRRNAILVRQNQTNDPRARCREAGESNLRVVAVLDLASLAATDGFCGHLEQPVEDFMDCLLDKGIKAHPSIRELRKLALANVADDEDDDMVAEYFGESLYGRALLGFAVNFSTPVMTKTGRKSYSFSWGYTTSQWIYAETYEKAWALGIAWAEDCLKRSKPAKRAALSPAPTEGAV